MSGYDSSAKIPNSFTHPECTLDIFRDGDPWRMHFKIFETWPVFLSWINGYKSGSGHFLEHCQLSIVQFNNIQQISQSILRRIEVISILSRIEILYQPIIDNHLIENAFFYKICWWRITMILRTRCFWCKNQKQNVVDTRQSSTTL